MLDSRRNSSLNHLHIINTDTSVHWQRDRPLFYCAGTSFDVEIWPKNGKNRVCLRAKRKHSNSLPADSDATTINLDVLMMQWAHSWARSALVIPPYLGRESSM